jgi:hypothetical protein
VEKRHGRIEERIIEVSSLSGEYLGWPEVKQVFRVNRRRYKDGKWSEELAYGITSLSSEQVTAAGLLALARARWSIENSLHYVRDVTFHEDRCRTRSRNIAQLLAAGRNTAITLIRRAGYQEIPAGLENFAENRSNAIRTLLHPRTE